LNPQDRDARPPAHDLSAPVSVIIPCYRCADTVGRAVASVVSQTRRPRELVLVDDASPDGGATLAALYALARAHGGALSVRVIRREVNGGPGAARNSAWVVASQPYLAFLDADDAWHPRKIELQYAFMQARPEATLSAHPTLLLRPGHPWPPLPSHARPRSVGALRLLLRNCLPTRTVMLRRDAGGRFEEGKRHSEDYLLWLRLVLRGASAWRLGLPLACSFKGDAGAGGLSGSLWRMQRGELDTYARLRREGLLPGWLRGALVCVSLAKFAVRSVRVTLARLFASGGDTRSCA
jgi:glycosyltransferase involved in cell wall biosynthesis